MELLAEQGKCFENIKTLCTNYKKDSIDRKTAEYLNSRLSSLERQWVEFHERNELLTQEVEDKSNVNYFTANIYGKTKQLYETTKTSIMNLLILHQQKENEEKMNKNLDFDLSGIFEDETDENIQLMVSRQKCNFKALERAMSKINIDLTTEKWELEDNLATLRVKWEPIDKLHWELEGILKESDLYGEYSMKFDNIEKRYDNLRKQLNTKIHSNIHYQHTTPRIDIPDFFGDYIHWMSFKNLFLEAIHKNPTISKSQKMQHLKTKLKGEAERLVQHLNVSAENYDSCWEILTHRYDNRRLQFTSFINAMQELPVIQFPTTYNLKKLHDVIKECLNGLTNMDVDVTSWGPMIVHFMSQKLDTITFNEYSKEIQNNRELPDLSEFLLFLESKFMALETMKNRSNNNNPQKQVNNLQFNKVTNKIRHNYNNYRKYDDKHITKKSTLWKENKDYSNSFFTAFGNCPLCDGNHVLMQCTKFIDMSISQRNNTVAKLKVCKNCLYSHNNTECYSTKTCKECNLKHHTLLHYVKKPIFETQPSTSQQQGSHHLTSKNLEVLLTTVQIKVKAKNGTFITLRALLDQGSQVNLITENAAQLLQLPREKLSATVSGVGSVSGDCKGRVQLTCQSIHNDYTFCTQALVLKRLTNNIPNRTFPKLNWPHLQNLKLGDPDYNISGSIDILFSADVYAEIIMEGVLKGDQHSPVAQQTQLGWILCGKLQTFNCHLTIIDLSELSKYWENEDITEGVEDISPDDQCEEYYRETTTRSSDGKYIVKMPMKTNYKTELGNSRPSAVSQYLQLEKRLTKNEKLSIMYKDFINEYFDLKHMKLSSHHSTAGEGPECYLPHHGVLRENSITTKLRVVFNASNKTSSGKSLNNLMEKGPNLQKDSQTLILKWRTYKYAFTADIEKMYRCIWVSEDQHQLQKIIWRHSPTENLKDYTLCTLTYGTKCAPWLAMRTLKQLALDDGHKFPAAAKTLQNEFYVDDLISGSNSLDGAIKLQNTLIELLKGGGFNLRKWSSNCTELLENLHKDQISSSNTFDFKQENSTKTLGLGWNPNSDTFIFNWNLKPNSKKLLTKRTLLSEISQLYDPLGWLCPVTVTAKIIFQQVWKQQLEWDEELPTKMQNDWINLRSKLTYLKTIKIKRWIGSTARFIDLCGFCDASEKAYSCVVYTRVISENEEYAVNIFAAKTRVAPLSQKMTLPRLELSGALLLSRLMEKAKDALKEYNITTWAWSDSKVVLAWLQGDTSKWEKYVGNRVQKIKKVIPPEQWSYIESKNNPADCATRGLDPKNLSSFSLWWNGPSILKTFTGATETGTINCLYSTDIDVENKLEVTTLQQNNYDDNLITDLVNKCSSFTRVKRIVAWIMRFIIKIRSSKTAAKPDDLHCEILPHYLTTRELLSSSKIIICSMQRKDFKTEYNLLAKGQIPSIKSPIYKLNPYLDEEGIIRVGGRLNKTTLPMDTGDTQEKIKSSTCKTREIPRKGGSLTTMFISLLSLFLMITGAHTNINVTHNMTPNAQITNLGQERPIYYDTMGKVQLIHDEWILLTYYNLSTYWKSTQELDNYLDEVKALCQKLDQRYCESTTQQLFHEMELLKHHNTILLTPHKHLSARKKRGLIDGVGYVANSLFGILDQRFAEKYQQDIQAIQNNEKHLLNLIKNQTSIVEMENDIMRKNEENIRHQFELMNKFMNDTSTRLASLESRIGTIMATNYFSSVSLTAHLLLNNLKNIQEIIFNALIDVYKGHIDVHLLTPVNLIKQLNDITGKLPKTLTFPVENIQEQIKDVYKLLYMKARVTSNYFMFEIHIPLTRDEEFTLYRPIPLPLKTEEINTVKYVFVSYQYLAVNFGKGTFISLNADRMNQCIQRSVDNFVCNLNLPITNLESKDAPCEAKLLSHLTTSPCITHRSKCEATWIELHSTNTWLAACCGSCVLRTVCAGDVTTYQIKQSALITLKQGCVIQNRDSSIYAHNRYRSDAKIDFDLAEIPLLEKSINHIFNSQRPPQLQLLSEEEDLASIDQQVKQLKRNEMQLPQTITEHDIHQYALGYSILGLLIILIVAWIFKKRCLCTRKQYPIARPPTKESVELDTKTKPEEVKPQHHPGGAEPGATAPITQQERRPQPRLRRKEEDDVVFHFE